VTGGDLVRVVSPGGAFEAIVEIDDRMRDDVVMCWEGHPPPNGPNAVTAEIRSNLGNNASYNQVRVKLERV
ncbi:MAG: hypothetical protein M1335_06040, partial [Chloroflexi bacterium]|nr:hypothetical protein [Chloroflexota bacterium]